MGMQDSSWGWGGGCFEEVRSTVKLSTSCIQVFFNFLPSFQLDAPNITHSFAESCESKIGSNFKGKRKWYQACAARNRSQILTKSESGSCMNACHAKRAMLKRGDSCLWQESQRLGAENLTHLAHINRHIKGQLNYLAPFTLNAYFEICLFINRKQHNFF